MITWLPSVERLGLRRTVMLTFALASLILATLMSLGTYFLARGYLIDQRVDSATRQAYADAAYVRSGLLTSGREVSEVLELASPPSGTTVLVHRYGVWYSSSLTRSTDIVPTSLIDITDEGGVAAVWTRVDDDPAVAIGIPLPGANATYYEVALATEMERTLGILARVLMVSTAITVLVGAGVGRWAAGRLLLPVAEVASASARIAAGEINARLRPFPDPDLATIAESFNAMLDALAQRIEREARFTADVAHELRSPLTTLTTSVQLMEGRRAEMAPAAQAALDLMSGELGRFRRMLEDLLELGRLDAGELAQQAKVHEVSALLRETIARTSHDPDDLLRVKGGPWHAVVDRGHLSRALVNLITNADLHGDGVREVVVSGDDERVYIEVHDSGPGVPEAERERVFDRFQRGGSRGSRPGAGLGLSLVAETVRALGGTVAVGDSPMGGAVFTVTLPASAEEDDEDGDADDETADHDEPKDAATTTGSHRVIQESESRR